MLTQYSKVIINAYFGLEISETSPSYPSLLLKCVLNSFQSVHFPSNMGHNNQEMSFPVTERQNH